MKRFVNKIMCLSAALLMFTACAEKVNEDLSNPDIKAARALAERVLGKNANKIAFGFINSNQGDFYKLEQQGGKVLISGNNANSMAAGLNNYLKHYCKWEYGWTKANTFGAPTQFPKLKEPILVSSIVNNRFFLNYCTFGYTMPWWKWEDWEHFIDWMALNGVTMPLAITGQEAIWYKVWTEMGLTDEEIRNYFTGPAHLPWHRMQNIDRWFAPLPKGWLEGQAELQKQILQRERELGMTPILPAFNGHVPAELKRLYPDAPITKLEPWSEYDEQYACSFLEPMSDLYTQIQHKFLEKQTELYGTDHIYGIDIFNELVPPSWEPEYLGSVSKQVYESLAAVDSSAIWLQMGWMFFNEKENWTPERVQAYLTAVPKDKLLVLDYYCDYNEVWKSTKEFYGTPYIWCYLGNFGGNSDFAGRVWNCFSKINNRFKEAGSNFSGIGCTLEALDCNPFMYEFILEQAWRVSSNSRFENIVRAIAEQRVGGDDEYAQRGYKFYVDSISVVPTRPGRCSWITCRPNIGNAKTWYSHSDLNIQNTQMIKLLDLMFKADSKSGSFNFDLVNFVRQMLDNHFGVLKKGYDAAVMAKDMEKMTSVKSQMLELIDDLDKLLGTQEYFLLGKWIEDARSWGTTEEEKNYYESNARNLITTWGEKNMLLNDYANRDLNGLISSFYKVRWEMFFQAVEDVVKAGGVWTDATYNEYNIKVTDFEKQWWSERIGEFITAPLGNGKEIAKELYAKYREQIQ